MHYLVGHVHFSVIVMFTTFFVQLSVIYLHLLGTVAGRLLVWNEEIVLKKKNAKIAVHFT